MTAPALRPVQGSTAITGLGYVPLARSFRARYPDADGFLFVRFASGSAFAYLVPSWVPGLILASRSRGKAYTRLVRRERRPGVEVESRCER
jgi:hypothetical protein